jgi:hypothetical protein
VAKIPDADAYRARWAALEVADRRRIVRAVNRGRALDDPKEAALAVHTARNQQRFWRKAWLIGPVAALLTLTQGAMVYLVNAAFATAILGLMAWFWYRRSRRSETANRHVAERAGRDLMGEQPPTIQPRPPKLKGKRQRRR